MQLNLLMKKVALLVISIAGFSPLLQAQHTYSSYQAEENSTRKASAGLHLWNLYLRNDLDSLKILGVDLLLTAAEDGDVFMKAVGEQALGSYQIRSGNLEKGIFHLQEARRFYMKREDYDQLTVTYNELGNARFLQGKYQEAIKMYLSSLRFGALAPDPTAAFSAKIGLGKAYVALGDTAVGLKTIEDYKEQAAQVRKFESVADAYAYMGEVEMERNVMLSKEYYEKSIIFSVMSKSKAHLSHGYNNKAIVLFNLGDLDSSLFYFQKALDLRKSLKHRKGIVESYYNLAFFYQEQGKLEMALKYYELSSREARKNGFNGDERDALLEIKAIAEKLKLKRYDEVVARLKFLEVEMESTRSTDEEIIAYAEKVIQEAQLKSEKPVENGTSSMVVWLIGGALLLMGLLLWRVRRKS